MDYPFVWCLIYKDGEREYGVGTEERDLKRVAKRFLRDGSIHDFTIQKLGEESPEMRQRAFSLAP